jgi:hypothetical protein
MRFNGPERGAWYAAFRRETSQAEVAFHRGRELQEINWPHAEVFEYVEYLADFRAELHDIRKASEFPDGLAPDSYAASWSRDQQELSIRVCARRSTAIALLAFGPRSL